MERFHLINQTDDNTEFWVWMNFGKVFLKILQ